MRQRRSGTSAGELRGAAPRVTAVCVALLEPPALPHRVGRPRSLGSTDEAEVIHRGLFHHPPFLSTVIRPVRKDSHVREP
ncbi:hypothetical protein [Streptomyces sp. NBC_01217]|uniref:hypothetical protein n=1 Tax=Streptomyces sp. NBC_01217 TaxID=2903779 RepID=UPI002E0DD481|nr:hypothetical protein OG507_38410 [Streptomyces sp. NBC_01217]